MLFPNAVPTKVADLRSYGRTTIVALPRSRPVSVTTYPFSVVAVPGCVARNPPINSRAAPGARAGSYWLSLFHDGLPAGRYFATLADRGIGKTVK